MNQLIRLISLLILIPLLAPAVNLMGQPDYPGGIKLTGNYDPALNPLSVNKRSEITFEQQELFSTESLFRVEFRFSLFNTLSRGSFVKFSSAGKFRAEISHLPQLDNDTSFIRFQIETDKTYITDFPLLKKVQSINNWNYLSFRIDFLMQKAVLILNSEVIERRILLPLGEKSISLFNTETDPIPEIPDFCLRELKIITDHESLFFPFAEKSGSRATDYNTGKQLRLRNTEWLYSLFTDGLALKSTAAFTPVVPLVSYLTSDGRLLYESKNGERVLYDPADGSFSQPATLPPLAKNHGISTELNFEENTLYIKNGNERYRISISELDEKIRPDIGSFNSKNICYNHESNMIYGAFLGYDKSVASVEKIDYYMVVYSYSISENWFRLQAKKHMHILEFNNTVMIPRFDRNELHFLTLAASGQSGPAPNMSQLVLLLSFNKPEPQPAYDDLFTGVRWYYFLFAGAAAALTFSVIYRRRIFSRSEKNPRDLRTDDHTPGNLHSTPVNVKEGGREQPYPVKHQIEAGVPMIRTFGIFEISDIYGNIITSRITGKRREILLYMLTKFEFDTAAVFTPEELKDVFFSDLSDDKFNKNLKVHLSNLRNNLKSIELQSLKNDGITLLSDTEFDFITLNNLISRFDHAMFTPEDAKKMCDILGKGKFLAGEKLTGEWLISRTDEINLRVLNLIRGVITEYSGSYDSRLKLRLAHLLSVHAPLSEESLYLKISVYMETGNTEAIRSVYEGYSRSYKMLTGEKYGRELTDILRGQ